MVKSTQLIIGIILFSVAYVHCQVLNETDTLENSTQTAMVKPFVYYGRYWPGRFRRQLPSKQQQSNDDLTATQIVLSILPLDRIGAILGQIMSTGLKEMLDPNVGKKIVNVIQNQGPSLLTSLFTNLYTTLHVPPRTTANQTRFSVNRQLNNTTSSSSLFSNYLRDSRNSNRYS